jgi:hypothetical protein
MNLFSTFQKKLIKKLIQEANARFKCFLIMPFSKREIKQANKLNNFVLLQIMYAGM